MLKKVHSLSILLILLLLASVSINAHAQVNVLANPGFTSDFTGWGIFTGRTADWFGADSQENPNSGSARVSNDITSDGVVPLVLFQCIEVLPQQEIQFGGDIVVGELQPEGTSGFIFVEQFVNSSCSGTPESFHSASSSFIGQWRSVANSITTASNVQSVRFAIGVFKPTGETENALAFFDNLFMNVPVDILVNPSMSASWFNPAESGHGIMIHLLDDTTAWMCWFTFNNAGEPVWICSLGIISGDTITFENAFMLEGGFFPPNFNPALIVEVPWGSIVVVFTSCDAGTMTWTTSAAGFQSGSMPLARLTTLWGNTCVDPQ